MNQHVKRAVYIGTAVALADQLSKWWLVNSLMRPPHVEPVTPFLNLVLVHNKGITFGLLNSVDHRLMPYILMGFAAIVMFFLGRWLVKTTSQPVAVGLALVMGGAFGNMVDRVREGAVIDFLDFYYRDYHWYAFNVADAAITVGVGLLILDSLLRAR